MPGELRIARLRIARVQIERHVKRLDRAPERPVLRQVVVSDVVGRTDIGKAVDQGADETEVVDAALQLGNRLVRVVHRQRGEGGKAGGALGDVIGQHVVGLLGHRDGGFDVMDRLHRRRIQRQDHHLDAVSVHFAQARVMDVDQPGAEIGPHMGAEYF